LPELRAEIEAGIKRHRPVTEPGGTADPVGGDADTLAERSRGLQTLKIREDIYKDRLARQQSDPAGSVELAAARAAEGMSEDKMLAVRLELQARNGVSGRINLAEYPSA
jgi:hypothetical protein